MLYRFHPQARAQQIAIWQYTRQQWGEKQADSYIKELHQRLSQVAQNFSLLRSLPAEIDQRVRFFRYQRHCVFVKESPPQYVEKLDVLTILHERMDIPNQLRKTLVDLE